MFLLAGVALGLAVGVLPGLGGSTGLALLLPFIYGMEPAQGIALMMGVLSVIATADTFPAVLIGVPGSVSGQATVVDGFPMAQAGEGARALSAAFAASLVGGLVGAVILTAMIVIAEPVLLAFGTGEMLMLAVLGVTMVGILTGTSWIKGLLAAVIGMAIGTIGIAPASSEYRLDFGVLYLSDGIPLIVVAIAVFAVPEITDLMRRDEAVARAGALGRGAREGLRDVRRHFGLVLRSSGLGTAIGMLPGLGGAVVDWIAYAQAVQTCKGGRFGQGDVRGVIAPESANNAKEGGALVPTLIFGIPGSAATAILIGGLVLLGVEPGITLVQNDLPTVYTVIWSLALANIAGAGACIALSGPISKLTAVRFSVIAPFMVVLLFFAAYQSSRSWGDFAVLIALGALAMLMRRFGYPRSALMIGFVLADPLEVNLYQTIEFYGWSVFARPAFLVILGLCVLSAWSGLRVARRARSGTDRPAHGPSLGQWVFLGGIGAGAVAVALGAAPLTLRGALFPLALAGCAMGLASLLAVRNARAPIGAPDFHDAEAVPVEGRAHGMWTPLLLVAGPALIASLTGFWLAAGLFTLWFLRRRAGTGWPGALWGAALVLAGLALLGHVLRMTFPPGLLQSLVALRFPLG